MDKTITVGQKWLANELDLHFLTLKKFPIQSVNSFKSYRANKLKSTETQTDRHIRENHFFGSEGLTTWRFDKNGGWGTFCINLIPSLMRM